MLWHDHDRQFRVDNAEGIEEMGGEDGFEEHLYGLARSAVAKAEGR